MEVSKLVLNKKEISFTKENGEVLKVSKRVETSINMNSSVNRGSSVLGGSHNVSVKSSNTTITEIWLKDGDLEKDHTIRADLSLKEDQKVSIIYASSSKNSVYAGVLNHNTKQFQSISSSETNLKALGFISPFALVIYIFLFFFGFVGFSLGGFAGLISLGAVIYYIYYDIQKNKYNIKEFEKHLRAFAQQ